MAEGKAKWWVSPLGSWARFRRPSVGGEEKGKKGSHWLGGKGLSRTVSIDLGPLSDSL